MQTVARSNFTTVKTEGAILPADLLQRVADGELEGLLPQDYHLAPGEKLNEAINRAWNRCLGVWQAFNPQRQNLSATDSGVTLTRERWLLILLQELGYGRLPYHGKLEIGGADGGGGDAASAPNSQPPTPDSYPISHVWEQTPIHLVSFRQELDRRDPASKRSPHSLVQEFLNRSEAHLWGIVSNGLALRLLRDNVSLTRAAYLEFDLEMMMSGELYADFSLLWLVCHQSRVEIQGVGSREAGSRDEDATPHAPLPTPSDCWLEKWSQAAAEQGTRALDALRDGVQEAIAALGRGFLAHPANAELRRKLNSGELSTQDYYRQLLRLVYRLIFLFVAEDRDLLLLRQSDPQTRQRYTDYYSLTRLRGLAETRRGGPHPDLYRTQRRMFELLREGYLPLGLPALGSFLFSGKSTPALDGADIANSDLLNAIRALAFTIEGRVRRPVDYKNLGSEELGSVYESLLELHPRLNIAAAGFELATAAGSERKTTGSYYTPSSLINSLLDTALEPVVEARLNRVRETPTPPSPFKGEGQGGGKNSPAEAAILSIKVVDPACGSGHFLIAAANRLALHLSRVRTGDDEPGPAARREALREVVRHCIHGVDINEMSVELCKVALWLETLDPGKPLTFLEANIQCGNSLLGATPALLAEGIPDEAFTPITGDDKSYCSEWKAQNKKQRGQRVMALNPQPWERLGDLAAALAGLEQLGDGSLAAVRAQESGYAQLVRSSAYETSQLWADAWCAAFVWRKQPEYAGGFAYPITEAVFREIEKNPFNVAPWMRQEIERLRGEYQFFHWHLAFPQVFGVPPAGEGADNEQTGWNGGFDVVLGNPPWEVLAPEEQEFFSFVAPEIVKLPTRTSRLKAIQELGIVNPDLALAWENYQRQKLAEAHFCHNSQAYPLSGSGNLNSYLLFTEISRLVLNSAGQAGLIVPSALSASEGAKSLFNDLVDQRSLVSLYDFENKEQLFPAVHRSMKFCLVVIAAPNKASKKIEFAFFLHKLTDLQDRGRRYFLSRGDLELLNPNSNTAPTFPNRKDAELVLEIYKRFPILLNLQNKKEKHWQLECKRMVDLSYDSKYFENEKDLLALDFNKSGDAYLKNGNCYLPVYEAKMTQQFDHRAADVVISETATIRSAQQQALTNDEHRDPIREPNPRFWMPDYQAFRSIPDWYESDYLISYTLVTSPTNQRTTLATIIPRRPAGHSLRIIYLMDTNSWSAASLCGCLNSFVLDYISRQKIGGVNLNPVILYQLPAPPQKAFEDQCAWSNGTYANWLMLRVLELSYNSWTLQPFARDCGYLGAPFRWDEARRFLLRCELDAAYFHLYGIARDDVAYIMETFPIVKRKDEAAHGEYRTQRVILEIYDEMQQAIASGQPYQTRLDPPPADARVAHPWDAAFGEEPEELWKEEKGIGSGELGIGESPTPYSPLPTSPQNPESLILQNPVAEIKPPKKPKAAPAAQGSLIEVLPPPGGPRSVRLKRAMALGGDPSPLATRELVAFLADEDSNIRWLAGSTLVQRPTADTVAALAAFLSQAEPARVAAALPEARRVLALIADTAEADSVRQAAGAVLGQTGKD